MILVTRFLVLCLVSMALFSTASAQTNATVAAIQQEYNRIHSQSLKKERYTYEAPGCVEDGVVHYFLEKGSIVKVTESGSIGDGSWTTDYYYQSGKLIFCYEVLVGGPAAGEATKTEYRYYFKDNRCVRFMRDKKIIEVDSKVTEALQRGNKILEAYPTKDFAGALCE